MKHGGPKTMVYLDGDWTVRDDSGRLVLCRRKISGLGRNGPVNHHRSSGALGRQAL